MADVAALIIAGHAISALHLAPSLNELPSIHAALLYLCSALALLLFPQLDIYSSWRGRSLPAMFVRIAFAWALALSIGVFASFMIGNIGELSRTWALQWYAGGVAALLISRIVIYQTLRYLRGRGLNQKRVVLIGYGTIGREMHRRADEQAWMGYEVHAVQAQNSDFKNGEPAGITRIPNLEDIPEYVSRHGIDEIWITLPMSASAKLNRLQYMLRNSLVDVRWVPDMLSMQILSSKMVDFLGMPVVNLNEPMSSGVHGLMKELFDRAFAFAALLCLSPVLFGIAVAIKLSSPGPVLFRQPRLGLNGKPFNVYKFRSMVVHQEHDKVTQATQDDPRITPIGRFLRRTSLDELPQFINVLMGDMSVVGPRPHALQHNEMYKQLLDFYMLRHRVKPGITGWAQIHGYRGETDTVDKMAKRVQFDLHYIRNWSLWMDIRIIAWTAFKGWTGNNAY
jgi:putative colanic acid biosynthesis UDP-glucose lipid carrier transferase